MNGVHENNGSPLKQKYGCQVGRQVGTGNGMAGIGGDSSAPDRTFGQDIDFLREHSALILLADGDAQVAVAPEYQGRVMTSTFGGRSGRSFGWLNYRLIEQGALTGKEAQGRLEEHVHVFGGEERFWLGPEGGQFGLFFKPGTGFDFAFWHTPAVLDTEPFNVVMASSTRAVFRRDMWVQNASGTVFDVRVDRDVVLLSRAEADEHLGGGLPDSLRVVAYATDNRLTNTGGGAWTREKGLLSVWLLGMYKPAPRSTVVIPIRAGPEAKLGPRVNDTYFGIVPRDYLAVKEDALFFRGDGTRRFKIGISPARAKGVMGCYDADANVLTLVSYNLQPSPQGFVNSMWERQKDPYSGDVINAYNDGSPEPGKPPLGPFFEMETSSPAAALRPGETMRHVQWTVHVSGARRDLDRIAREKLGVGLEEIAEAQDAFGVKGRISR